MQPVTAKEWALILAQRGLPVFPLKPNSKLPYESKRCAEQDKWLAGGVHKATLDLKRIAAWFDYNPDLNYGVCTSGVIVFDVDCKNGAAGPETLKKMNGHIPPTFKVQTPSSGCHIYMAGEPTGQRDVGPGINVRSKGGYVVGPGCVIDGVPYTVLADLPLAVIPHDLRVNLSTAPVDLNTSPLCDWDPLGSWEAGVELVLAAPKAYQGERGSTAYRLACRLKDLGISEERAVDLLEMLWAGCCEPPAYPDVYHPEVSRAYQYGRLPPGIASPSAEFEVIPEDLRAPPKPQKVDGIQASLYKRVPPQSIDPREWIYGQHLARGYISATVAPGGVGKTQLVLTEAIAVASNRELMGEKVHERGRIWYWNGEDPFDELQRRIEGICLHHNVAPHETDGWLYVDSGRNTPIVVASEPKLGIVIVHPIVDQLIAEIRRKDIKVMVIDPFVACHEVTENNNRMIQAVARQWALVAEKADCAIELVHHSRKTNGLETTVEDARGAVALIAATRSGRTLNKMSKEEAQRLRISTPGLYVRVDNGKANMAPPGEAAKWFKLINTSLGNKRADRKADSIGVPAPWEWPDEVAAKRESLHRLLAEDVIATDNQRMTLKQTALHLQDIDKLYEEMKLAHVVRDLRECFLDPVTVNGITLEINDKFLEARQD